MLCHLDNLLNNIKPLTTAISKRWKNKIFHHLKHFRIILLVPMSWSERSTPFKYLLYLSMALGWWTVMSFYTLPLLNFLIAETLLLALSRVVTMDTALLSTHYKTRQGGSLSQCIFPLSNLFAHCLGSFRIYLSYFLSFHGFSSLPRSRC